MIKHAKQHDTSLFPIYVNIKKQALTFTLLSSYYLQNSYLSNKPMGNLGLALGNF